MGRRVVLGIVALAAFALLWFCIAGRATWAQGWAFLLAFSIFVGALAWRLARADPDLLEERNREADDVEPWDKTVIRIYSVLLVALLVITALDSGRQGWSAVPVWLQLLGWALLCVAASVVWHVVTVNTYLSSWARIQDERDHTVVSEGLYGYVRHPMYSAIILGFLVMPLALASYWAVIPGALIGGVFVYRTEREDRMLRQDLPGYGDYAVRVRYRLAPGIW
jgi:protein-S-isoprenylcysteine O-methyltransferase Ste14